MMTALTAFNTEMENLKLNYEFGHMSKAPPDYPYWVGDYTESEPLTEDGMEIATILLTGFSRGKYVELEQQKNIIKDYFKREKIVNLDGAAVVFYFSGSLNIPVEDNDLKKCQINISVKMWKGR